MGPFASGAFLKNPAVIEFSRGEESSGDDATDVLGSQHGDEGHPTQASWASEGGHSQRRPPSSRASARERRYSETHTSDEDGEFYDGELDPTRVTAADLRRAKKCAAAAAVGLFVGRAAGPAAAHLPIGAAHPLP